MTTVLVITYYVHDPLYVDVKFAPWELLVECYKGIRLLVQISGSRRWKKFKLGSVLLCFYEYIKIQQRRDSEIRRKS